LKERFLAGGAYVIFESHPVGAIATMLAGALSILIGGASSQLFDVAWLSNVLGNVDLVESARWGFGGGPGRSPPLSTTLKPLRMAGSGGLLDVDRRLRSEHHRLPRLCPKRRRSLLCSGTPRKRWAGAVRSRHPARWELATRRSLAAHRLHTNLRNCCRRLNGHRQFPLDELVPRDGRGAVRFGMYSSGLQTVVSPRRVGPDSAASISSTRKVSYPL
jgi:hypothetical protein